MWSPFELSPLLVCIDDDRWGPLNVIEIGFDKMNLDGNNNIFHSFFLSSLFMAKEGKF